MVTIYKDEDGNSEIAWETRMISKEEALKYWPDQPERSKREDRESGCGALNSMETC